MEEKMKMDECFYGSATVGERGQIVIPAEARKDFGINPGDKVLVMRHPVWKGLMISHFEDVRGFLDDFSSNLERVKNSPDNEENE